jgi:hypothetical protein
VGKMIGMYKTGKHFAVAIAMLAEPTSAQRQAFELIGAPIPLTLK